MPKTSFNLEIIFNSKQPDAIYNTMLSQYKEVWKWILNDDGSRTQYQISNHGRLKNTKKKTINDFSGQNLIYYRGYVKINGEKKEFSIHRLVAMYFCEIPKRHKKDGKRFDDLVPNHKDGNKHHNAAFNLEWVTGKENTEHAWREGLCDGIRGENAHLAKISEKEAIEICECIMKKMNNGEISKKLGIGKKTIQHIRSGECWKHITSRYKFPKLGNSIPNTIPLSTIHGICKMLELKKYKDPEIAALFGVKRELVKDIRTHRRRKDISKDYDF
jgi:hypothetical protein